jgi:hypothetical protein
MPLGGLDDCWILVGQPTGKKLPEAQIPSVVRSVERSQEKTLPTSQAALQCPPEGVSCKCHLTAQTGERTLQEG